MGSDATAITRRARSNLAFALRVLPRERRRDAVTFYAYCRVLDDLADEPGLPLAERAAAIEAWKQGLHAGFEHPGGLEREVCELRDRLRIPNEWLCAIADGCLSDLHRDRHGGDFATRADLESYIWQVACAVGLVAARVFGCSGDSANPYAESLGRALQWTNILRDVGEDLARGRLYLPLDDLARHGLTRDDLGPEISCDPRFLALMDELAARAREAFAQAAATLPPGERRALRPARIMAGIYHDLLERMQDDGFDVFITRYRVPWPRKCFILLREWFT